MTPEHTAYNPPFPPAPYGYPPYPAYYPMPYPPAYGAGAPHPSEAEIRSRMHNPPPEVLERIRAAKNAQGNANVPEPSTNTGEMRTHAQSAPQSPQGAPIDIIIPLGGESKSNNDELRILLRSIAQNASGVGKVCIVSDKAPAWLSSEVDVLKVGDSHPHNKDANIIIKVLAGIHWLGCERFCFCADDNAFLRPVDLREIPVIKNQRQISSFEPDFKAGEWHGWKKRMYHTLWLADQFGMEEMWAMDCHAPQTFDARKVLEGIGRVNYRAQPGLCIYTLFRILEGIKDGDKQAAWKVTVEADAPKEGEKGKGATAPLDKVFIGYNDGGFLGGLRERLLEMFPEKCRYEK